MKKFVLTCVVTLMASQAFAQTPYSTPSASRSIATGDGGELATLPGNDLSAGVSSYTYNEPGAQSISIHAPKFVAEYTGTFSIKKQSHWFGQAQARGLVGNTTYDGWCYPFLIRPEPTSPNGYALGVGDASPCSESGDKDWYLEGRGLVGKDLIGQAWALSPYSGIGLRHLSNGIGGVAGYRTENYLYLPLGATVRASVASRRPLSFTLEYDRLLHGWNTTRDSRLGGGDVPATSTTPAFTVDGFTDISFTQSSGWALRASAKVPVTTRWSVEPYYVYWNVKASPVNYETATFTVHNITVQQQLGAYEPDNNTSEFGVRFGFRF
jgi:hypothetical protein